ncbi:MAG: CTP synthase, partial [Solirubrobacterales bacterium]
VASQFHPEFNSRPTDPEPLFRDFVGAAAERASERGEIEAEPADEGAPEAEAADRGADISARRS